MNIKYSKLLTFLPGTFQNVCSRKLTFIQILQTLCCIAVTQVSSPTEEMGRLT